MRPFRVFLIAVVIACGVGFIHDLVGKAERHCHAEFTRSAR